MQLGSSVIVLGLLLPGSWGEGEGCVLEIQSCLGVMFPCLFALLRSFIAIHMNSIGPKCIEFQKICTNVCCVWFVVHISNVFQDWQSIQMWMLELYSFFQRCLLLTELIVSRVGELLSCSGWRFSCHVFPSPNLVCRLDIWDGFVSFISQLSCKRERTCRSIQRESVRVQRPVTVTYLASIPCPGDREMWFFF